jgi:membrane protease YdiL (CAAX protease family)
MISRKTAGTSRASPPRPESSGSGGEFSGGFFGGFGGFGVLTVLIVGLTLSAVALAAPAITPPTSPPASPPASPPPNTETLIPAAPAPQQPSLIAIATSWLFFAITLLAPLSLFILWRCDVIRPGAFKRRGLRETEPGWTPLLILAALFVFILSTLAVSVAFSALAPAGPANTSTRENAIVTITGHVFGIAAAIGAFIYLKNVASIPSPRLRAKDLKLGLLCLALTFPVTLAASQLASITNTLITGKTPSSIGHSTLATLTQNQHDLWAWVLVGSAVLLAPILEELLYRGLLQTGLLAATRRVWTSILFTTALFTFLHIDAVPSWTALVPIAALSIAMGIAYERTKSLGVPIVMHIGFNAINTAMAVLLSGKA